MIVVMLCLSCGNTSVSAQVSSTVNKATGMLKSGKDAIYRAGNTVKKLREGRSQFDSTVRFVRDNVQSARTLAKDLVPPKFKHGKFSNFKWKPVAQFEGQIFPSMVISMAGNKGKCDMEMMRVANSSALGFWFRADRAGVPIHWEIESVDKSYFDKVSGNFTMSDDKEAFFMPFIPWNLSLLASLSDSTPIRIVYRLSDAAGNKEERAERLVLRPVDDCIVSYDENPLDFLYAAFIQEKHPEAVKIVKEAAKTKFTAKVEGYKAADLATLMRVCAVWKLLHERGLKYTHGTALAVDEETGIVSQRMRAFDKAIKAQKGNSVDGMIVLATLLRAMGISTTLELTHDHCFVGFYTSGNLGRNLVYLNPEALSNADKIDAVTGKDKNNAYIAQFMAAIESARKEHARYAVDNDLREIDLGHCRPYVQPLPFN